MPLTAPPEAVYPNVDTAFTAIQAHAKKEGYAFYRYTKRATRVVFACDRARKYDSKGKDPSTHSSKQRQSTGSKKCGCLMKVELRLDSISSNWSLKVLEAIHNHSPSAATTAHPAHRIAALTPETRALISTLSHAGLSPSQILTTLRTSDSEIPLLPRDIANIAHLDRLKELNGRTPIQWLLEVRSQAF
jgi:hypothetical protein